METVKCRKPEGKKIILSDKRTKKNSYKKTQEETNEVQDNSVMDERRKTELD